MQVDEYRSCRFDKQDRSAFENLIQVQFPTQLVIADTGAIRLGDLEGTNGRTQRRVRLDRSSNGGQALNIRQRPRDVRLYRS